MAPNRYSLKIFHLKGFSIQWVRELNLAIACLKHFPQSDIFLSKCVQRIFMSGAVFHWWTFCYVGRKCFSSGDYWQFHRCDLPQRGFCDGELPLAWRALVIRSSPGWRSPAFESWMPGILRNINKNKCCVGKIHLWAVSLHSQMNFGAILLCKKKALFSSSYPKWRVPLMVVVHVTAVATHPKKWESFSNVCMCTRPTTPKKPDCSVWNLLVRQNGLDWYHSCTGNFCMLKL